MYIMDDNERTNANNRMKKLQEEQRRQARRHRNAAEYELQTRGLTVYPPDFHPNISYPRARAASRELESLHTMAADALEVAANATPDEFEEATDVATRADQQAVNSMLDTHGRTFTPEAAGGGRKKTKSRKSRRKHKKTKSRKSRRKHKKTKRKQRR